MPIRAVIFDIVDVLLCYPTQDPINKWDTSLGFQKGGIFASLTDCGLFDAASTGKYSELELWEKIGFHLKLNNQHMCEFVWDLWSMGELNRELALFLNSLRPQYKTATLSNDWPGARWQNDSRYGFSEAVKVDTMLYSAEEGMQKPEARFFQLACRRLDVQPEEAVFLDDREENIATARLLGMKGVVFKSTKQAIIEVQAFLAADS